MLAELKSTWDAKASAHEERKAMRSKELLALQDPWTRESKRKLRLAKGPGVDPGWWFDVW